MIYVKRDLVSLLLHLKYKLHPELIDGLHWKIIHDHCHHLMPLYDHEEIHDRIQTDFYARVVYLFEPNYRDRERTPT